MRKLVSRGFFLRSPSCSGTALDLNPRGDQRTGPRQPNLPPFTLPPAGRLSPSQLASSTPSTPCLPAPRRTLPSPPSPCCPHHLARLAHPSLRLKPSPPFKTWLECHLLSGPCGDSSCLKEPSAPQTPAGLGVSPWSCVFSEGDAWPLWTRAQPSRGHDTPSELALGFLQALSSRAFQGPRNSWDAWAPRVRGLAIVTQESSGQTRAGTGLVGFELRASSWHWLFPGHIQIRYNSWGQLRPLSPAGALDDSLAAQSLKQSPESRVGP